MFPVRILFYCSSFDVAKHLSLELIPLKFPEEVERDLIRVLFASFV